MNILKLTGIAIVSGSLAAASFAGTLTEPDIMEVEEAVEGSSASSNGSGILLPLLGLVIIAALIANDDTSAPAPVTAAN